MDIGQPDFGRRSKSLMSIVKLSNIRKPLFPFRAGQHTFRFFAKPAIAIARYTIVNYISDGAGNNFEKTEQEPGPAKPPDNF